MAHPTTLEYGAELLACGCTPAQLREQGKVGQAVKLYQQGFLSTGAAAEFANVPKTRFLTKLADFGVATFELSREELRADLTRARRRV